MTFYICSYIVKTCVLMSQRTGVRCNMFLDAFLDCPIYLLQASSVGQTAVFPKILMFSLFWFRTPSQCSPHHPVRDQKPQSGPSWSWTTCISKVWGSRWPDKNHKNHVLSLAMHLCFEIKVLLNAEGISKALLCNLYITAFASQTKGQENK